MQHVGGQGQGILGGGAKYLSDTLKKQQCPTFSNDVRVSVTTRTALKCSHAGPHLTLQSYQREH